MIDKISEFIKKLEERYSRMNKFILILTFVALILTVALLLFYIGFLIYFKASFKYIFKDLLWEIVLVAYLRIIFQALRIKFAVKKEV